MHWHVVVKALENSTPCSRSRSNDGRCFVAQAFGKNPVVRCWSVIRMTRFIRRAPKDFANALLGLAAMARRGKKPARAM